MNAGMVQSPVESAGRDFAVSCWNEAIVATATQYLYQYNAYIRYHYVQNSVKGHHMQPTTFRSLHDFWPYYVREHSRPVTRWLHFVGNTNLLVWLVLALLRRDARLVLVAVITSYGLAWIGHFGFERNIPATFRYPVKAGVCDMLMYLKMWQGTMDAEVARYAGSTAPTEG
jgi:hypothetical protein